MNIRMAFIAAIAAAFAAPALAQEPTPEWSGQGSLGAGVTTGNTKTTDASAGLKIKHTGDVWSETVELGGDYGETNDAKSRNRYMAAGQVERSINDRLRGFGRVAFENDEFSGFKNRYTAGIGLAYDAVKTDAMSWTVQGGPGYRIDKIRPTADKVESAAFLAGSAFAYKVNDKVTFTNDTSAVFADTSNQYVNSTALTMDLMGNLQARISYDVRHDTDPPAGFKQTDTATRFSLVYKIG